jgi:hypothetical protein
MSDAQKQVLQTLDELTVVSSAAEAGAEMLDLINAGFTEIIVVDAKHLKSKRLILVYSIENGFKKV